MNGLIINTENGNLPVAGPMALVINERFDGGVVNNVDLTLLGAQGRLSYVQTLYIDASNAASDVKVTSKSSQQVIIARAGSQGYYPVMADRTMKFSVETATTANININFCNFPVAAGTW